MTSLPYVFFLLSLTLPSALAAQNGTVTLTSADVTGWRTGKCETSATSCHRSSTCQNGLLGLKEYFRCVCPAGLTGDGYADSTGCVAAKRPCSNNTQCHANAMCNLGFCVCKAGFFGDGFTVCSASNIPTIILDASNRTGWLEGTCSKRFVFCDRVADCQEGRTTNSTYFFRCICPTGYVGDGYVNGTGCPLNRTKCQHNEDCHQYGVCNTTDKFCICKEGFSGDGADNCKDINDCINHPCDKNAKCVDIPGSFVCTCNYQKHYEGNGTYCVHRCDNNFHCHPDAKCNAAKRDCECKPGYEGDGVNCTDIDECLNNKTCEAGATCINEPGSHKCQCQNGYTTKKGQPGKCFVLPRDCEDIRVNFTHHGNGMYDIDPDFTGPANKFMVYCKFLNDYAVTMALMKEDVRGVDAVGEQVYDYSTDHITLQALLGHSYFCYQSTLLECKSSFSYNADFRWLDAFNQSHTSWAGSSEEGKCGCAQLKKCQRCNCNRQKDRDFGFFVDKTKLPVMSLRLGTSKGGKLSISPLRCGPRVFDVPSDCEAWRHPRYNTNGAYHIDLDGPYGNPPILVYCDLWTHQHTAVTEMQVQVPNMTLSTHQTVTINYLQGISDVVLLAKNSMFCIQRVVYYCKNSGITGGRVYVNVSSDSRQLDYFPGANKMTDSCGCGATHSCKDPSVRCDCDIMDGVRRRDMGDIIDKNELPVRAVTGGTTGSVNYFYVSHLQCGHYQFGVAANCEQMRATAKVPPYPYTYFIDPDAPPIENNIIGNVPPFLVECVFNDNPAFGITVIHHFNETWFEFGAFFLLKYIQVTLMQIQALKKRSTYCIQEVDISCQKFSLTFSGEAGTWTDIDKKDYLINETFASCKSPGGCQCDGGSANKTEKGMLSLPGLPIMSMNFSHIISQLTSVNGSSANISVGPLQCTELFPTCAKLYEFVKSVTHLGEKLPEKESVVTIDPDGAGNISAFEVACKWPVDTIVYPEGSGELSNGGTEGKSKCFDVVYRDPNGDIITPEQLLAMRDESTNCFQSLQVQCLHARVHGMVNFTTCDGKEQIGWAGSVGQDSCQCGVTRHCAGGKDFKCHCDLADGEYRKDGAVIIHKNRLPVCKVCMSLDGIPANMSKIIPVRRLRYYVSSLNCHAGPGRHVQSSCQVARLRQHGITKPTTEIVYMNPQDPIPVACKLYAHPPVGQLEVFPEHQVFRNVTGNITLILQYYTVNMTILHSLMLKNIYCAQRIYFFCVPENRPDFNMTGKDGWRDIYGTLHKNWTRLLPEEIEESSVCDEFSELCQKCKDPIRGYVIYNKGLLPITAVYLTLPDIVSIVVDSAKCSDLYENCYEILKDGSQRFSVSKTYAIDPDGPGGVSPLKVNCIFKQRYDCAVTTVTARTKQHKREGLKTSAYPYKMSYNGISTQQIQALANLSAFCWQPVSFDCKRSPLINMNQSLGSHYELQGQTSYSFGTGKDTDFLGCACGVTGTCAASQQNKTCNCDANTYDMLQDGGMISHKEKLPMTEFFFTRQTLSSYSKVNVGSVKCSNSLCQQFPVDCHDALVHYKTYRTPGILDYQKSGEYFINPRPEVCTEPFLVYCEMDLVNKIGITKIITKAKADIIMRPGDKQKVEYYGPTEEQMRCLIDVSEYCIQPVAYNCYAAKLLGGGAFWYGPLKDRQNIWGGGNASTCACGAEDKCGGDDSRTNQLQRECTCDIMDSVWRKDAGVLTNKGQLPLTFLDLSALTFTNDSRVNVSIGDLQCGQKYIAFNECSTAYHDCSEHADCLDREHGYDCKCHHGWEGKTQNRTFNTDLPVANGRECPDDNECTFHACPIGISDCVNTPGSFECFCHKGFTKTGPTTCEDINECTTNQHNCDVNAKCINQYGTFKCVCHKSFRGNGTRGNCNQVGNCVLFGDPHSISFDERWADYQGVPGCPLVAITDVCPGANSPAPGQGKITVLYIPWRQDPQRHGTGEFTWVKSLEIYIRGFKIEMLQKRELLVNGIKRVAFSQGDLIIFDNGKDLVLRTGDGIEIYWDGDEVAEMYLPTSMANGVCGMCGNYNGNATDDWMLGPGCNGTTAAAAGGTNGTVLTTTDESVFGNSWMVPSAKCVPSCEPVPPDETCVISRAQAEQLCNQVYDSKVSSFKECLKKLDPVKVGRLEKTCWYDICRVESDVQAMVCKHAELVAQECQLNTQVDVSNWRTTDFCSIKCKDNRVYRTCDGDLSQQTDVHTSCLQLRAPDAGFNISTGCVEGCHCPKGYVEEGAKCVKEEDCGCFHNGSYITVGQELTSENCTDRVVCEKGGVVRSVPVKCPENENCTLKDNVVGCHCIDGYIRVNNKCKPDPCTYLKCGAGAECVEGQCQCRPGYQGDCEKCHDLDECATDQDFCNERLHEKCVNTVGSYYCTCESGYYRVGRRCKDVDECELGQDRCPANSQCVNRDGDYACSCCLGYVFSKGKCVWEGESTQFFNASAPNSTCCDCNTPLCNKTGSVCGSDGVTYPSVRALVVQACQTGKKVHPMYEGKCQPNCTQVKCMQPYAVCEESASGVASCGCPSCTSVKIKIINVVCASDTKIYLSKCEFEAAMCINNIIDIVIVNNQSKCLGNGGPGGAGIKVTDWSECNVPCGFGEAHQNRTVNGVIKTIKAVCYKSCENQTCKDFVCTGARQCTETSKGPMCICPWCGGEDTAPVCGAVGKDDPVTYRNLCELKREGCIRNEKYYKLEDNACPRQPLNCDVMNFYEWRRNKDGCVNTQPERYPVCKGGCGNWPDNCCYKDKVEKREVAFKCPNGITKYEVVENIKSCKCIPPEELAKIKAAENAA